MYALVIDLIGSKGTHSTMVAGTQVLSLRLQTIHQTFILIPNILKRQWGGICCINRLWYMVSLGCILVKNDWLILHHFLNIFAKDDFFLASISGPRGFYEPEPCQENTTPRHSGAARSLHHKKQALCPGMCHICSCSLAINRMTHVIMRCFLLLSRTFALFLTLRSQNLFQLNSIQPMQSIYYCPQSFLILINESANLLQEGN